MAAEIFDVDAALKEFPESEVAQHLAELHGIDRAAYLKEGMTDADFLKEHGHMTLPAAQEQVEMQPQQQPASTNGGVPLLGGMLGTAAGSTAAGVTNIPTLAKKAASMFNNAAQTPEATTRQFASPSEVAQRSARDITSRVVNPELHGSTSDVYNWSAGKQAESGQYGKENFLGGANQEHEANLQRLRAKIEAENPMYTVLPGTNGMIGPKTEADRMRQEARARANELKNAVGTIASEDANMRAARLKVQNELLKRKAAGERMQLPLKAAGLKPVMGGLAGYNAADALQQAAAGHYLQSGLGAAGTAASLAPMMKNLSPKQRAAALAASVLMPALNRTLDHADGGSIQGYADGGSIQHFAGGKDVKSKLIQAGLDAFIPTPTRSVKFSEALAPHEGKWLNVTQADRMRSTMGDLGGPGFSKFQLEHPEYAKAKAAWGVKGPGTATGIINTNKKFPEGKAIWTPLLGHEAQHRSNQHTFDRLTEEFNRQVAQGKLPEELRQTMNNRLGTWKDYSGLFPEGIDVANPEHLANLGSTFDRRAAIAEVLGGKGVGGRKAQVFDYPGIMNEMTDPETIGAPTHSVGTRLFTLSGDSVYRPDLHSAFPQILTGVDQGVSFPPVPKELALPTWISTARDFTGREPGYYDYIMGIKKGNLGTPSQEVTEKYLTDLQKAGYKAGGHIDEATLNSLFE